MEEHAWMAGLFDGEGTTNCTTYREYTRKDGTLRRTYPYFRISITQNMANVEVLHKFAKLAGGNVYGPHPDKKGMDVYKYTSTGVDHAYKVLQLMWPHLCTAKKEQAIAAMAKYKAGLIDYPRKQNRNSWMPDDWGTLTL